MMNYAGSSSTTILRCWSSCTGVLESHWISGRQKYYFFSFFLLLRSNILWRAIATNTKMNILKKSDKIIVFFSSFHFFLFFSATSPHHISLLQVMQLHKAFKYWLQWCTKFHEQNTVENSRSSVVCQFEYFLHHEQLIFKNKKKKHLLLSK